MGQLNIYIYIYTEGVSYSRASTCISSMLTFRTERAHYEETADREYKEWESKGGVKMVRKRNNGGSVEDGTDVNPAPTSKL